MRKFIMVLAVLFMAGGIAFAASKVATFGVPNSAGTAPLEVDSDRLISVATDATVDVNGAVNVDATVTADDLVVTGTIVDAAIYTKAAGSYPQRLATIGADGTIYGTRSVLVDGSLYTASAGTGAARNLCISVDGVIYASALTAGCR